MRIAVVGTGYVGLVSGVCLSAKGHDVTCVDLRADVVDQLNRGEPHIHEKGLAALLQASLSAGRFRATGDLPSALAGRELVLIAVGTPSVDGKIDLTAIRAAASEIGGVLRDRREFLAVVVKSTVIPGTTDTVVQAELEQASGRRVGEFGLGMNPEFLREGNAVEDFMEPDRIVFGHEDPRTLELLRALYAPWECDKIAVPTRTAEFIKYANNCLLATQISAVNELANLAAALGGVDIADVMRGVHADKRWNPILAAGRANPGILTYLVPGCGFGGSCFPKDVQAMRTQGTDAGQPMRVLQAVLDVNEQQPGQILQLLRKAHPVTQGLRVLVLGLAFKADTDDVRESASRKILADLASAGCLLVAHDPVATENARASWPELPVNYVNDWRDSLASADAVVVATKWPEYSELLELATVASLAHKTIVDARRMFSPGDFPTSRYLTIGFNPQSARS
jgi:UDPglucose 6-dehydrogenase